MAPLAGLCLAVILGLYLTVLPSESTPDLKDERGKASVNNKGILFKTICSCVKMMMFQFVTSRSCWDSCELLAQESSLISDIHATDRPSACCNCGRLLLDCSTTGIRFNGAEWPIVELYTAFYASYCLMNSKDWVIDNSSKNLRSVPFESFLYR